MPRVPAPVRIVTPKRGEAEHHKYAVRIHTAHEPSGRRTTINREAIVESASPEQAAAAAIVHIAHALSNEGREPPDGTRYQVSIHGESTRVDSLRPWPSLPTSPTAPCGRRTTSTSCGG